jgi:hypothetical protein
LGKKEVNPKNPKRLRTQQPEILSVLAVRLHVVALWSTVPRKSAVLRLFVNPVVLLCLRQPQYERRARRQRKR